MYLDISRLAKIADSVDAMNLDIYGSNPEIFASVDRPLYVGIHTVLYCVYGPDGFKAGCTALKKVGWL